MITKMNNLRAYVLIFLNSLKHTDRFKIFQFVILCIEMINLKPTCAQSTFSLLITIKWVVKLFCTTSHFYKSN